MPQSKQCRLAVTEFGLHSNNNLSAGEFVILISPCSQLQKIYTVVMKRVVVL